MARKVKVPNHLKRRLERRAESPRKSNLLEQRRYFLIVCEGEKTEPLYFESLKKMLPKGVLESAVLHIEGMGMNTLRLVEETIAVRDRREAAQARSYDQVWVVFDRDSFKADHFNRAIFSARQTNPEIFCAWSNQAFELWYLLHFSLYEDAADRRQYGERLEREISGRMGGPFRYEKNHPGMFRLLATYGNVNQAISWADRLEQTYEGENYADHNPCTRVHRLVRELLKLISPDK